MASRIAAAIVTALEALGVTLRLQGEQLVWDWCAPVMDDGEVPPELDARFNALLADLRACKTEAVELIVARASGRPYLVGDCLIVPFAAPERYRWWLTERDDLALHGLLVELGAGREVHQTYCGAACQPPDRVACEVPPGLAEDGIEHDDFARQMESQDRTEPVDEGGLP